MTALFLLKTIFIQDWFQKLKAAGKNNITATQTLNERKTKMNSAAIIPLEPLYETELLMGIDPGFSGAIAVYNPKKNKIVDVIDMPTTVDKKPQILISELSSFIGIYAPTTRLCVIEDVGAMPGQGVVSMFRFGFATGIAHGVVGSFLIPTYLVKPQIWKACFGLSREKHFSIEKAKKFFPDVADKFTAKKDGRAEAALLAKFGERIK